MSTLELECPGCEHVLELDAGFAGGVCRCSSCGTLMTVPAETGQAAETVKQRSARPVRPATPGRRPAAPARPEKPAEASAPDEQVYTTASGREVHLRESAPIPTAQSKKRVAVRFATALLLVGLLAVVLAFSGVGVWLLSTTQQATAVRPRLETFEYDPRINPYQQPLANVLGMPLAERAVVVVDAGEASASWLDTANHALRDGLLGTNSASQVVLVYASDAGLRTHPDQPRPLARWRDEALSRFHANLDATGEGALAAALVQAMQWTPEQVVLIAGREPGEAELAAMRDALTEGANQAPTLDVVMVSSDSVALDDMTADYNGRYVHLTPDQLQQWRSASPDATPAGQ